MPSLSEFVSFIVEKSGVKDVSLIESDITLHRMLKGFCSSPVFNKYLFKGGSCLTKCYLARAPKLALDIEGSTNEGFLVVVRVTPDGFEVKYEKATINWVEGKGARG
jgi:predicted nucleotidyltransferase component of viral defense system